MRFLLDENVSPRLGDVLRAFDHEAILARSEGQGADDATVVLRCAKLGAVLLTQDTEKGMRRALSGSRISAVWLPEGQSVRRQAAALLYHLDELVRKVEMGGQRLEIPPGRGAVRPKRGW